MKPITAGPKTGAGAPGKTTGTPNTIQRIALYLRASTAKKTQTVDGEDYTQRPEIQEERLRRLCQQRGWKVVGVYTDRASGRKESRPHLNRLMADARRGLFDVVAVAAMPALPTPKTVTSRLLGTTPVPPPVLPIIPPSTTPSSSAARA